MVDLSSDGKERRLSRVGDTIGVGSGDLSLSGLSEEEGEKTKHSGDDV